MNKEELIKTLESLKKSDQELKNAKELIKDIYTYGFGCGYNLAVDEMVDIIKKEGN